MSSGLKAKKRKNMKENVYYQGEDIVMRLKGNDVVNLDESDFVLGLYNDSNDSNVIKVEKLQCEQEGKNVWRAVVSKEVTRSMSIGKWDVELKVVDNVTSITSAVNVITIVKSVLA